MVRPPGFEPAPHGLRPFGDNKSLLEEFREFCRVDLRLSPRTIEDGHVPFIGTFLRSVSKPVQEIGAADIREYLSDLSNDSEPKTYNNHLGALKRFFRDFLQQPQLITSFKFAPVSERPVLIPAKADLQNFYAELHGGKYRLAFLFFATTGLRRNEVLTLRLMDIDRTKRMVTPNGAHETGRTKKSWISFYNGDKSEDANNKWTDMFYYPLWSEGSSGEYGFLDNLLHEKCGLLVIIDQVTPELKAIVRFLSRKLKLGTVKVVEFKTFSRDGKFVHTFSQPDLSQSD